MGGGFALSLTIAVCVGCAQSASVQSGGEIKRGFGQRAGQGEWDFSNTGKLVSSRRAEYGNLSKRIVVPKHCQMEFARLKFGSPNVAEIKFFDVGVQGEQNAVLELWTTGATAGGCYIASLGKTTPKWHGGFGARNELLFIQDGDVTKIEKAGTWMFDGATVRFSFERATEFRPLVAILRWLPAAELRDDPLMLFEGVAHAIILPKGHSLMLPRLRFPGR